MRSDEPLRPVTIFAMCILLHGCGPRGVTAPRLEAALAVTFANLIDAQETVLRLPPVDVPALKASATCHKVGLAERDREGTGAGSYVCTISWYAPARRAPLHETYDVSVTTDACFTATNEGAEGHVGGPTLTTKQGEVMRNLLHAFDGCFEASARQ
jgi:hypothetical protein